MTHYLLRMCRGKVASARIDTNKIKFPGKLELLVTKQYKNKKERILFQKNFPFPMCGTRKPVQPVHVCVVYIVHNIF